MAELIDISNEKFWDVLFDEACVEGQQAKRIETALKQSATTESEIRAMAIDEFVKAIEEYYFKVEDSSFMPYLKNVRVVSEANIRHIAEQLKEE